MKYLKTYKIFENSYFDENLLRLAHYNELSDFIQKGFSLGGNINCSDDVGNTPLLLATHNDSPRYMLIVKFIIKNGGDITTKNTNGLNFIDFLILRAEHGHYDYVIEEREIGDYDKLILNQDTQDELIQLNPLIYGMLKDKNILHPYIKNKYQDLDNANDLGLLYTESYDPDLLNTHTLRSSSKHTDWNYTNYEKRMTIKECKEIMKYFDSKGLSYEPSGLHLGKNQYNNVILNYTSGKYHLFVQIEKFDTNKKPTTNVYSKPPKMVAYSYKILVDNVRDVNLNNVFYTVYYTEINDKWIMFDNFIEKTKEIIVKFGLKTEYKFQKLICEKMPEYLNVIEGRIDPKIQTEYQSLFDANDLGLFYNEGYKNKNIDPINYLKKKLNKFASRILRKNMEKEFSNSEFEKIIIHADNGKLFTHIKIDISKDKTYLIIPVASYLDKLKDKNIVIDYDNKNTEYIIIEVYWNFDSHSFLDWILENEDHSQECVDEYRSYVNASDLGLFYNEKITYYNQILSTQKELIPGYVYPSTKSRDIIYMGEINNYNILDLVVVKAPKVFCIETETYFIRNMTPGETFVCNYTIGRKGIPIEEYLESNFNIARKLIKELNTFWGGFSGQYVGAVNDLRENLLKRLESNDDIKGLLNAEDLGLFYNEGIHEITGIAKNETDGLYLKLKEENFDVTCFNINDYIILKINGETWYIFYNRYDKVWLVEPPRDHNYINFKNDEEVIEFFQGLKDAEDLGLFYKE